VTVTPLDGCSRLALSSADRLHRVALPVAVGVQLNVVAVGLEPPDHRVLEPEHIPRSLRRHISDDRAVVAHGVGAALRARSRRPPVEAVAAVGVVRLFGRIGVLKDDVGMTFVVSDHKGELADADRAVVPSQICEVDA
jgi:hypothetical protein